MPQSNIYLIATFACVTTLSAVGQIVVEPQETAKPVSSRVAADFPAPPASGICRYRVPALSARQYLPDVYPFDGVPGGACAIVAAKGEYEPGAFLLYATKDVGRVTFSIGALKSAAGAVFPAKDLDLKTVKVWYQNGNGWYSYFADTKLKLCPELLLHDEDLIRVDTVKKANYARLTEKDGRVHEFWLTAPQEVYNRTPDIKAGRLDDAFTCMRENFCDAPQHTGAVLKKGEFKEFLLTANVRAETQAGLYCGTIDILKDGRKIDEVPVRLRVHDFALPPPATYADYEKPYRTFFCEYVSLDHIRQMNGNDEALARKQLRAILANFVRHNEVHPSFRDSINLREIGLAAGMDYSSFCAGRMLLSDPAEVRYDARNQARKLDGMFGSHKGLYLSWGDEYGLAVLRGIRDMVKIYHDEGFRFPVNSRYGYDAGGYLADLWWPPNWPDQASAAAAFRYNQLGGDGYFGWYATQHVGVENPAYIRRQYGMGPYRAGLSCNFNYAHHLQGWNDLAHSLYKPMMFVYGSGDGCIDTLAWEAFREAIDDIRYATLLQRLAHPLVRTGSTEARYAAKKALKLLADADGDSNDLSYLRLEMIRHIENLRTFAQ